MLLPLMHEQKEIVRFKVLFRPEIQNLLVFSLVVFSLLDA